jgi:hypothetical protein
MGSLGCFVLCAWIGDGRIFYCVCDISTINRGHVCAGKVSRTSLSGNVMHTKVLRGVRVHNRANSFWRSGSRRHNPGSRIRLEHVPQPEQLKCFSLLLVYLLADQSVINAFPFIPMRTDWSGQPSKYNQSTTEKREKQ